VAQFGCALAVFLDEGFELGFGVRQGFGIEDRAYVSGDGSAHVEFRHIGLRVLLEMKLAALPESGVEDGFECGPDAFVRVRSDRVGDAGPAFLE